MACLDPVSDPVRATNLLQKTAARLQANSMRDSDLLSSSSTLGGITSDVDNRIHSAAFELDLELRLWLQKQTALLGTAAHSLKRAPEPTASAVALLLASTGGVLHGVAMAMRKYYGEGHERYWLEWRWWMGTLSDGVAGMMIWPAMPLISVELLVPLVTVVQLSVAYMLGLFFFGEKAGLANHVGLVLAIAGILGVSYTSPHKAAILEPGTSLSHWIRIPFLSTLLACAMLLIVVHLIGRRVTFWALAAATLEAVQFITSRSLANVLFEENWKSEHLEGRLMVVGFCGTVKVACIVMILAFQQKGMEEHLAQFVGVYLVGTNLLTVVLGVSFFADDITLSSAFIVAACATVVGIWLLNCPPPEDPSVPSKNSCEEGQQISRPLLGNSNLEKEIQGEQKLKSTERIAY
eukprot:TRINITY_DN110308_c0_g1_i1.p1 TRINITY_DN110308_c0_g1~~TRINITY_DN110308_c0_g1_i1.p1  ORF type:complete len:407 (+),score=63.79 TRINITY_DN110308_c0_g1_i1:141-1361(+)